MSTIRDKHGVEYRVERYGIKRQLFTVHNHRREQVAYALVELDFTSVNDVRVDDDLQRRGIATALYDHIEREIGHKLRPYRTLYDDGRKFWAARSINR